MAGSIFRARLLKVGSAATGLAITSSYVRGWSDYPSGLCQGLSTKPQIVPLAFSLFVPSGPPPRSKPKTSAGRPVLLIHGLDSAKDTWADLAEELKARGMVVLAVDLRGSGQSPLGDPAQFSPSTVAADVHALAAEQLQAPYVVVGHSCGARVAMRFTADYPNKVSALVLEDMDIKPRQHDHQTRLINANISAAEACPHLYPSFPACRENLKAFGFEEERIDDWYKYGRIVDYATASNEQEISVHPVWSGIHPLTRFLSFTTILATWDGKKALENVAAWRAGQSRSGRSVFPIQAWIAGSGSAVTEEGEGSLQEMQKILPEMVVLRFPNQGHSVHRGAEGQERVAGLLEELAKH
eukprot:gb/GEZN01006977.1/.p1 GENE.gb/GEZN01006977.1/~~gb/GEZN01006977.1/.p1  ORF type:complete len:354 (+),score=42.13 gb/GEZN01006977.1/:26-1087(+)